MSRYIDADEFLENESEAYMRAQVSLAKEHADKTIDPTRYVNEAVHKKIQMLINATESADVVEVRHGKWSHDYIKDGMEYNDWFNLHCSVCGETQREAWGKWNYCPYCGAKMDGEEQENE